MSSGSFRSVMVATVVAVVVSSLAAFPAAAQQILPRETPTGFVCPGNIQEFHECALERARTFDPPRTPSGRPNLEGYWRESLTMAFTVEEVTDAEPMTRDPIMPWSIDPGMIVDPPSGVIPYQPWAAEIGRKGRNFAEYIDPRTACISGGVPRTAVQGPSHLLQRDDSFVWLFEDHHAHRIISLDGRPPLGDSIKTYHGDSRGHWEGNTLVIDVSNLNGLTWIDDSGNFHSDGVHLVERLTMIDPNTIHYTITFDDPRVFTQRWTLAWPMLRQEPGFELLEEACWEGERDLLRFLALGFRLYDGGTWRSR